VAGLAVCVVCVPCSVGLLVQVIARHKGFCVCFSSECGGEKKTGWWGKEEKELGIHNHLTHMRGVLGGIVVDLSEKTENSWRRRITPYGYIV